jgi:hypothetical protein
MVRLLALVEGETEETFVNEMLAPHLYAYGLGSVSARLMGNARLRSRRGGVRGWSEVKGDIVRHLRRDAAVFVTTMVDFYGLPQGENNPRAWPGRTRASGLPFEQRAAHVESAIAADVLQEMGHSLYPDRFIPFVVMHEFEGLLFSDCSRFARGIGKPELEPRFQAIRNSFASPEEINDTPKGHPSQRVTDLVPDYQKPLYGNLAALEVGFDPMRTQCPHFRGWLGRLENLGEAS